MAHHLYNAEPPQPSAHERELHEMAREYYRRTEVYDRTVCTLASTEGEAMPMDYRELALINENASKVFRELADRCGEPKLLRQAMKAYHVGGEFRRDLQALGTFKPRRANPT